MSYEKFTTLISAAVPLPVENVDTDQIIPARFLKAVERRGFGDNLFRDWRFDHEGKPKPTFIMNNPLYSGQILVAGKNFGSGSSREHAAWALYDYGFRVVVSSFFADIFRNNALNNGILPVTVPEEFLSKMFALVEENPASEFLVDLPSETITMTGTGNTYRFSIDPYKKHCLMNGLDDIDFLLSIENEINSFEKKER